MGSLPARLGLPARVPVSYPISRQQMTLAMLAQFSLLIFCLPESDSSTDNLSNQNEISYPLEDTIEIRPAAMSFFAKLLIHSTPKLTIVSSK